MKTTQKIVAVGVVALLGVVAYGLFRTGQPANAPAMISKTANGGPSQAAIVDQTPLLTAQRLVQMATSVEEKPFAEEALRLADHEMDLAFAAAVRDAEENPPVLRAQGKEIEKRLQKLGKAVEADKAQDRKEAESAAAFFSARHKVREAQIAGDKTSAQPVETQTNPKQATASGVPQAKLSREESAALVKATKQRSAAAKALASLDKRIDDQKQLAENYGQWIEAVAAKQRSVVHRVLNASALIISIS